jgi:hypothetical protein
VRDFVPATIERRCFEGIVAVAVYAPTQAPHFRTIVVDGDEIIPLLCPEISAFHRGLHRFLRSKTVRAHAQRSRAPRAVATVARRTGAGNFPRPWGDHD